MMTSEPGSRGDGAEIDGWARDRGINDFAELVFVVLLEDPAIPIIVAEDRRDIGSGLLVGDEINEEDVGSSAGYRCVHMASFSTPAL